MSDSPHGDLLAFLAGQFVQRDEHQCTAVELVFSPGKGFRDEHVRRWDRHQTPEKFEVVAVEKFATEIIELITHEVDQKEPGKYRYVVRTVEHLGERATHSIAMQPAFSGHPDENALAVASGARGSEGVIASHAGTLMRVNAQMFDSTIRVAMHANESLRQQNMELLAENRELRRKLDEAESTRLEREFRVAQAAQSMQVKQQGLQYLFQFGQIAMGQLMSGGKTTDPDSALVELLYKFGSDLRADQAQALMGIFDQGQMAIFMQVMSIVKEATEKKQAAAGAQQQAANANSTAPKTAGP
jgi:hypothetical protein